jgi:hypothetical protein
MYTPSIALRTEVERFVADTLEATVNTPYKTARADLNKCLADDWCTPDQYTAATEALRSRESDRQYAFYNGRTI